MALPRKEQGPQRFKSVPLFDHLHLENSFEDDGVAWQQVLDLLALEDDVFRRCLSAQPDPTALQRSNREASALNSWQGFWLTKLGSVRCRAAPKFHCDSSRSCVGIAHG